MRFSLLAVLFVFVLISCESDGDKSQDSNNEEQSGLNDDPQMEELSSDKDLLQGEELFKSNCVVCHGEKGKGEIGPDLTSLKTEDYTFESLNESIKLGSPNGMPSYQALLTPEQLLQVSSYVALLSDIEVESEGETRELTQKK